MDYLVSGQGTYRRYLQDPDRYGRERRRYEDMWRTFREVRSFRDGGYEVRVFRMW